MLGLRVQGGSRVRISGSWECCQLNGFRSEVVALQLHHVKSRIDSLHTSKSVYKVPCQIPCDFGEAKVGLAMGSRGRRVRTFFGAVTSLNH